ncbi:hypothetical protein PIB30_029044 [Stylosanthes scabra]|uniref:Uncharacterized protein n=1 Tax=Stylosanthes scabra TaxID=79078 RepID=A0ABU6QBB6_9FABA|nr:hypothetical protein [Stylosanthes scabra]
MAEDELPVFDGIGSGYGWSISAWQFWNSRDTPELFSINSNLICDRFCRRYAGKKWKTVKLSGNGGVTDGFKDRRAGDGSELVKMVVAQRPPPEPLNLNSHSVAEAKHWTSTLELENRARRRHHHSTAAAISKENERHTLLGYGDCAEISDIAKGKSDITLNEGGGWSQIRVAVRMTTTMART